MKPNTDFALDPAVGSTEYNSSFQVLRQQLREEIRDIRVMPNGYDFLLPADSAPALRMIQFLSLERLSFRYLRIAASAGADHGTVWVHVTGCERVKEFLTDGLLGG